MTITKIAVMANELETMIRSSKQYSVPGRPFMTTRQLASHLKIDGTLANNILRLLEKRQVIVRKPRLGSFIAEPVRGRCDIERLSLFIHSQYYKSRKSFNLNEHFMALILAIQEQFPGVAFTSSMIDKAEEEKFLQKKHEEIMSDGKSEAFILWSMPLSIQKHISESRLPAISFGTRYPAIKNLPSVDNDHEAATQLLVDYLRERGRGRFVCLNHADIAAGDQLMINGFQERIGPKILSWRFMPFDMNIYRYVVDSVLDRYSPDAVICHTEEIAQAAMEVCEEKGLVPGRDLDIVSYVANPQVDHPFPHLIRAFDFESLGKILAETLLQRIKDGDADDSFLPVRLKLPENI